VSVIVRVVWLVCVRVSIYICVYICVCVCCTWSGGYQCGSRILGVFVWVGCLFGILCGCFWVAGCGECLLWWFSVVFVSCAGVVFVC